LCQLTLEVTGLSSQVSGGTPRLRPFDTSGQTIEQSAYFVGLLEQSDMGRMFEKPTRFAMIRSVSVSLSDPRAVDRKCRNSPGPLRPWPSAMFDGTETAAR